MALKKQCEKCEQVLEAKKFEGKGICKGCAVKSQAFLLLVEANNSPLNHNRQN